MPDPKSRIEECSKLKIGSKEANDTGDTVTPFRRRSKVKFSRAINVETENAKYLPKERSTNLGRDGV